MSFRNGDKSREHRLRKARQKKRENVRKLRAGRAATTGAQKGSATAKPA